MQAGLRQCTGTMGLNRREWLAEPNEGKISLSPCTVLEEAAVGQIKHTRVCARMLGTNACWSEYIFFKEGRRKVKLHSLETNLVSLYLLPVLVDQVTIQALPKGAS